MDVILISCLLILTIWLFTKIFREYSSYRRIRNLVLKIPGPKPHWLWGNLDKIKNSVDYQNTVLKLTKDGAKMYCLWAGPMPNVGTTHPITAKEILRTSLPKALRICDGYRIMLPWIGNGLLLSSGPLWEQNRRLLTPGFHFEILKDYIPIYNKVADILLDNFAKGPKTGESVEIHDLVSKATLDTMLRCALSYEENVQQSGETVHPYVDNVRKLSHHIWKRLLFLPYLFDFIYFRSKDGKDFLEKAKFCHDFSEKIIAARKKALEDGSKPSQRKHLDFLDILLSARTDDGKPLDDLMVRNEVDTFMFEGHDTTASAISFIIYSLAKHPEDQEVLYAEVAEVLKDSGEDGGEVKWSHLSEFHDLTCFIKESMRLYSTVPVIARQTTQDIELDGVMVPAGIRVDINLQAIHHNPDVWENPEEFDMRRFDKKHIDLEMDPFAFVPFSAGPRNCIGQHFAMDEIKCIIAKLLWRFKVRDDPSHKVDLLPEVIMRSEKGIKVFFEPRK